ncbi:hypothetical protein [Nakamurella deserti]|uniref:hypothetical protein n=1 Tax=Nakamurella deserti TaxID=2164074 RepID=UPI0013006B18|nr:hypothetical protein [Nakamurella deserti]
MRAARWVLVAVLVAGCGTAPQPAPPAPRPPSTPTAPPSGALPTTPAPPGITPFGTPTGTAPPSPSASTAPTCEWQPCYADAVDDGTLPDSVREASGVAASSTDPDLYFVVDDGTGAGAVTAVHADGAAVGTVAVDGMDADNAEALAAGPCPTGTCLFVGDIGGNGGRDSVSVYRAAEPTVPLPSSVASERWDYAYPDGAFDAEAMLVTDDGGIVVITKPAGGKTPHRVYTGAAGGGDLVLWATFDPPRPPSPSRSLVVGNVVTDAARGPGTVLLVTYDQAVEFRAPAPDADPADFATWEHRTVPVPTQWQTEGVTYRAAGGCGYVVVSEKSPMSGPAIGSVACR